MKQITRIVFLFLFVCSSYAQDLKITEIMYNPAGGDNPWEWIEIYNSGTTTIDVTGYVLDDISGTELSEPNISKGSIAPKTSVILFDADDITRQEFSDMWGEVELIAVTNWSTLGNSSDTFGIWRSYSDYEGDQKTLENSVLQVTYENGENGWPDNDGQSSIFLNALDANPADGNNWSLSKDGTATPVNSAYLTDRPTTTFTGDIGSPGVPKSTEDTENPVLVCLDDISLVLDIAVCATTITIDAPTATDNSTDELQIEGIRSDGLALEADYGIGEISISWTATDASGNVSEPCIQKIVVKDGELPEIECPATKEVISEDGEPILLDITYASAYDFCDGQISVSGVRTDNEPLDAEYPVGETMIVWKATDSSGNSAECTQFIIVRKAESSENDIVSFMLEGQIGDTEINKSEKTVKVMMPFGTDLTDLTPFVELSEFAIVTPISVTSVDLTEPIIITVIAQNGTTQDWTVTAETEPEIVALVFEVNGNSVDFETVLDVGEPYTVGTIEVSSANYPISQEISGVDFVDTSIADAEYKVVYQVSDLTNTAEITETVRIKTAETEALSVISFTLVNADTNEDLFVITDGMQFDINSLPTQHLDIRANTSSDVESVRLSLDGDITTERTESLMPFALFQDLPIGDYKGNDFNAGAYTVAATPYSEDSLRGEMGNEFTINFNITDSCADFNIVLEVVTELLTCNSTEGAIGVEVRGGRAPYTYSWSHDDTLNNALASNLEAGEYTVTATDANGCEATLTTTLTSPELPEVTLLPFESVLVTDEPILLFEGAPFGGEYSGEGVTDGEFNPNIGTGIYEITYTYTDPITACTNSTFGEIEVKSPELLTVNIFTLVNADTNEDLFALEEGMIIDINTLPTLHLDIRANTSDQVESVGLSISGAINSARTESLVPYALFQDLPIGDYKGKDFIIGEYALTGVPFSEDAAKGDMGSPYSLNFELVDPSLSVTDFMLVNAETNEDLFLIEEGMQIDVSQLPTLHLDIRAITTDDVESVRISLAGAIVQERTESLVPYALFQDLPIGDYKGGDFEVGSYTVKAIPYSLDNLRGELGTALSINFEIVENSMVFKQANQMLLSPNPASTTTNLSFTIPTDLSTIQILDMLGRVVQTYTSVELALQNNFNLQINHLESGTYFVQSVDVNDIKYQKQLLIQH